MVTRYLVIFFCCFSIFCFAHDAFNEEEIQIPISLENLYVEDNHLFINVEGQIHQIDTLRLLDNHHWMGSVKIDYRYCRSLHRLCKQCDQCHTEGCRFFVRPCNLWK